LNNKVAGLLLIGFSLLTAVIAYGFDQLTNAVKASAGFIKAGGSIESSEPSVPMVSIVLILLAIAIGYYITKSELIKDF
jgi:hypothetical protein